ncbi:MAG: hypothetical protein K8R23_00425 [Chthoniobacter sp.]|nr:hypothetical protein [Chthoniobacter sp.]
MKAPIAIVCAVLLLASSALRAQEKPREKPHATMPRMQVPVPAAAEAPAVAAPSTAGPITDPAQIVAAFFSLLQKSSVDAAYASLTRGSRIAEKPEELKLLKAKTNEAIEVFGAISGHDLVETKVVGARLVRTTYVSHGRTFPLRWRFYFYNPDGTWRLIDLRVDDKLTGIFDEPEERRESDARP